MSTEHNLQGLTDFEANNYSPSGETSNSFGQLHAQYLVVKPAISKIYITLNVADKGHSRSKP